jgi:hypothetical protein
MPSYLRDDDDGASFALRALVLFAAVEPAVERSSAPDLARRLYDYFIHEVEDLSDEYEVVGQEEQQDDQEEEDDYVYEDDDEVAQLVEPTAFATYVRLAIENRDGYETLDEVSDLADIGVPKVPGGAGALMHAWAHDEVRLVAN